LHNVLLWSLLQAQLYTTLVPLCVINEIYILSVTTYLKLYMALCSGYCRIELNRADYCKGNNMLLKAVDNVQSLVLVCDDECFTCHEVRVRTD
jgi:hypothetical protein